MELTPAAGLGQALAHADAVLDRKAQSLVESDDTLVSTPHLQVDLRAAERLQLCLRLSHHAAADLLAQNALRRKSIQDSLPRRGCGP